MTARYCRNEEKAELRFHKKCLFMNPPHQIQCDWLQEVVYDGTRFVTLLIEPVYTRPVARQSKWISNLLQVKCPVWPFTFRNFEARQVAWQAARQGKRIEGSSIFEVPCLPHQYQQLTCPSPVSCEFPLASSAQIRAVGLCVLFKTTLRNLLLKLNLWTCVNATCFGTC
jgi:hypothetical protein